MVKSETLVSRRNRGRPPITEVYCSKEMILDCYNRTKSMRKTASELGIAVRTVFKYINEENDSMPVGGRLNKKLLTSIKNREVARDIDNLGTHLPRNVPKIVKLLNNKYTDYTINYFLKSRSKAALELLYESGNLLDKPFLHLRDIYGRIIPVGYFEMYQLTLDKYTLSVTIEATLKFGGKVTCRMSYDGFRKLLDSDNAPQITTATSE